MAASAEVVGRIVRMAVKRLPPDHGFAPNVVAYGLYLYLHGMAAANPEEQRIMDVVQEALTVRTEGMTYVVSTEAGAASATEWPSLEAFFEAQERVARLRPSENDTWSPWICMMCERTWEDGSEPEQYCPNCGVTLVRLTRVSVTPDSDLYSHLEMLQHKGGPA